MIKKNKLVEIVLFACIVFTSHVLLPSFNDGKDFVILSSWKLFPFQSYRSRDILCSPNRYFLRDIKPLHPFKKSEIFSERFLRLLHRKRIDKIKDPIYKAELVKVCSSEEIFFVDADNSLFDFYILRGAPQIREKIQL